MKSPVCPYCNSITQTTDAVNDAPAFCSVCGRSLPESQAWHDAPIIRRKPDRRLRLLRDTAIGIAISAILLGAGVRLVKSTRKPGVEGKESDSATSAAHPSNSDSQVSQQGGTTDKAPGADSPKLYVDYMGNTVDANCFSFYMQGYNSRDPKMTRAAALMASQQFPTEEGILGASLILQGLEDREYERPPRYKPVK